MTGFHTLEQFSFYAIPVFAMAVASGAWCIRLAFRYAGLLQRISGHEEGAPSDRPGDTKQGGQGRVYNVSDPMPYFDASGRSEEHTSELQSLMRISYAVFCLKKKRKHNNNTSTILTYKIKNMYSY